MPYLQQDPNEYLAGNSASGATTLGGATVGDAKSAGASYAGDGGQGATTTAGSGASPAATNPGGGYTNLLSYLSANQGAGATTGQAAANTVQQSANDAQAKQSAYGAAGTDQINQAASGLGVDQGVLGRINSGAAKTDASVLKAIQGGGYVDPTSGGTGAGIGNATGKYLGPSAPNVSYGGPDASSVAVSYGGPNTTGQFSGAAGQAQTDATAAGQKVSDQAKLAQGNQSDVSGLLRSTYSQPNYSAGENSLDAFLAGGTQGGRDALNSTKGIADSTTNGYQGIEDMLSGKIQGAKDLANATNATYAGAVDNARAQTAKTAQTYQSAIDQATKDAAAHKVVAPIKNNIAAPLNIASAQPAAAPQASASTYHSGNPVLDTVGNYVAKTKPGNPTIDASPILNPVNKAVSSGLKSVAKGRMFAEGGEVPDDHGSFASLFQMLGRGR